MLKSFCFGSSKGGQVLSSVLGARSKKNVSLSLSKTIVIQPYDPSTRIGGHVILQRRTGLIILLINIISRGSRRSTQN
jgi:hypothetical protein